jgi:predicted phage terminase large subunit-like protein
MTSHKYKDLYTTDKKFIYLKGGRGSAKSYEAAEFALRLTFEVGHVILYSRYTLTSAETSIIPEFTQKIDKLNLHASFDVKKDEIVNVFTKSRIIFKGVKTSSGNQTANLKSLTGVTTWIYDEFEEHPDFDSFDKVVLSVRQVHVQNRIILISNALHKKSWQHLYFFKERREDTTYIETTYLDNIKNLSKDFIDTAEETKVKKPSKYLKDFIGIDYDNEDGALWKWEHIQRISEIPTLSKIVIAIDPAVTANPDSDETGIIVVGSIGEHGYILEDISGKYSPNEWANKSVAAYDRWKANYIVAEVNQGGDMVEAMIKNINRSIKVKQIHANKGKVLRAEPVVSLYESGRVFHVNGLYKLEDQMTTWDATKDRSPDRIDAMVYGVSDLLVKPNHRNYFVY